MSRIVIVALDEMSSGVKPGNIQLIDGCTS